MGLGFRAFEGLHRSVHLGCQLRHGEATGERSVSVLSHLLCHDHLFRVLLVGWRDVAFELDLARDRPNSDPNGKHRDRCHCPGRGLQSPLLHRDLLRDPRASGAKNRRIDLDRRLLDRQLLRHDQGCLHFVEGRATLGTSRQNLAYAVRVDRFAFD